MWGSLFLTTSFIELSSIYTVILILQRTTWYWIMKTAMDIPDKEGQKRLVIVGGGFGGLKLARKLKSNKFQIVLLDKNNHHLPTVTLSSGHSRYWTECHIIPIPKNLQKREHFHIRICEAQQVLRTQSAGDFHRHAGIRLFGHCHRLQHKLFWKRRAGETDHGTKEYFGSLVQPKPDIG